MADDIDIVIEEGGDVRFIYDDEAAPLFEGESQVTVRASHVEPHSGGWVADMSPSGGPVLFADGEWTRGPFLNREPFKTRAAALAAEREWLRAERGL